MGKSEKITNHSAERLLLRHMVGVHKSSALVTDAASNGRECAAACGHCRKGDSHRRLADTPEHFVGIAFGGGNSPLLVSVTDKVVVVQDRFLVATAHRDGQIDRLVFRFDKTFQRYDCRVIKDVEIATANLTVLETGLCLCLNEDEELEMFHCQMGSTKLELIADTSLCGEMKLSSRGTQALVRSQRSLYRIEMA